MMSYMKLFLAACRVLPFRLRARCAPALLRPLPRVAAVLLLCVPPLTVLSLAVLTSCDKQDEPVLTVDYFFTVVSGPPDYEPVPKSEMVYTITGKMKESLREVYPRATVEGNDGAVVGACDQVYRHYLQEHPEAAQYFYCEARLHRAKMRGSIVASYVIIKRYNF